MSGSRRRLEMAAFDDREDKQWAGASTVTCNGPPPNFRLGLLERSLRFPTSVIFIYVQFKNLSVYYSGCLDASSRALILYFKINGRLGESSTILVASKFVTC